MPFSKDIHLFQHKLVDLIQIVTIVLYITISFGLSTLAPQYLIYLQHFLKIYVSLFLIYRFNDFRTVKLTNLDKKIGFNAGILLIGSDIVNYIVKNYSEEIDKINILQASIKAMHLALYKVLEKTKFNHIIVDCNYFKPIISDDDDIITYECITISYNMRYHNIY